MNNITMVGLVLGVLLAAAVTAVAMLLVKVKRLAGQVADFPEREKEIRSDARKRSRTVHMASISEQLAPLLPGFRYNHKDVQWVGGHGAIDAIVWNGLEAGGDVEIVFLDVKTGPHAHLTANQRRIREAIAWKRIAFDVYSPPETPLLIDALSPGLPDDEVVSEGQADDELDQQPDAWDASADGSADVPVPIVGELLAGGEPGS
jgi:hypothetical protein